MDEREQPSGTFVSPAPAESMPFRPPPAEPSARDKACAKRSSTAGSIRPIRVKPNRWVSFERWLVRRLLQAVGDPPVSIVLWNGEQVSTRQEVPVARLRIRDRSTLWKLIFDPGYQFAEGYVSGTIQIEGHLLDALRVLNQRLTRTLRKNGLLRLVSQRLHRPGDASYSASRKNIHHHYDIGNEFYKLWLDSQLVYTCGYFPEPGMSLEQAQVAKLDQVCRKVWLTPGDTVYEAGCGWGALARHMALHYGAKVRAFNISHEQIQYARDQLRRDGLADRIEFIEDDWRSISGQCDVFISVGMLEHVGLCNYGQLSDVIHGCLKSNGRGLIHSIGRNRPQRLDPWTERRIFPGAYPPSLREMLSVLERHDFSVLDIENLRLHYAQTLRHWLRRYEQSVDRVQQMFDDEFVRAWRLYLTASVAAFENGDLQLFQVTFARGHCNQIPKTRAYLYDR